MELDIDLKNMIGELVDAVAGNHYEGWEDYWADRNACFDQIVDILDLWKSQIQYKLKEHHQWTKKRLNRRQ